MIFNPPICKNNELKKIILLSSALFITMPSWACLNTYVEDFYTSDS